MLVLAVCGFFIPLIRCYIHSLCISEAIQKQDHILFFHPVLFIDCLFSILDHSAAFPCISLFVSFQFVNDHIRHRIIIVQDIFILFNVFQRLFMFLHERFDFQTDQFIEAHLQNRCCLLLGKAQFCCLFLGCRCLKRNILHSSVDQAFLRIFDRLAAS